MAQITPFRALLDELELKYRSSVSESTMLKVGAVMNFLQLYMHQEKQFFLNGPYLAGTMLDGMSVFQYDAEIFNVWAFNLVAGISGTTQFDCRVKPRTSGSWTSIFTTKPAITTAAGSGAWVGIGNTGTGLTAPVLTSGSAPLQVNAGDGIVMDLLSAQSNAENCGLIVQYRPR